MADVIITPASGLIDFQNTSGISSATIQLNGSGDLIISAAAGDIQIGDTSGDIFVGDGINNVDIVFEQDGEIRGLTNKTVSLGQTDSYIKIVGGLKDSSNNVGTASSVLLSTGSGISWTPISTAALQGVQGTQGLQGRQGTQGLQGRQGTQGVQGLQGRQGTQGVQGLQGRQGTQGTQGTQGLQGLQGLQGTQGLQGISGTGQWTPNVFPFVGSANILSGSSFSDAGLSGGIYSSEGYTRGVYSTFKFASGGGSYVGFGTAASGIISISGIAYGIKFDSSFGEAYIYEGGSNVDTIFGVSSTTIFSITYDGANIRYWKDGVIQRTVTRVIGGPLYFLAYFQSSCTISSVGFGPMGEQGSQGTQGSQGLQGTQGLQGLQGSGAQGISGTGQWTVEGYASILSGSSFSTGDVGGGIYSSEGYTRGVYSTFKFASGTAATVGFGTSPAVPFTNSYIAYGIKFDSALGEAYIYESGSNIQTVVGVSSTTIFSITYDGANIRYWKDGTLLRTVARSIGNPLYFAAYFQTTCTISSVGFGPMGEQGSQGLQGTQGLQGLQGSGSPGTQGSQGLQGTQGLQGLSNQGIQGLTGGIQYWTKRTSNYTAVPTDLIVADTSGGTFTVTLPSSPNIGETVRIADGGDWEVNNLTIDRNGNNIEGLTEDFVLDIKGIIVDFVYEDVTDGWQVYASTGPKDFDTILYNASEKVLRVDGNTVDIVYSSGTSGNVGFCSNPTGDITLNVTNIPETDNFDNQIITFSVVVNQTGTARTCTAVNFNGVSKTIRWIGGSLTSALSGVTTTIGYTIFNFTGINTVGSALTTTNYEVLGVVTGDFRV